MQCPPPGTRRSSRKPCRSSRLLFQCGAQSADAGALWASLSLFRYESSGLSVRRQLDSVVDQSLTSHQLVAVDVPDQVAEARLTASAQIFPIEKCKPIHRTAEPE